MNCTQARALATDYIDGELAPGLAFQVEQHLHTCVTCPPLLSGLIALLAELRKTPPIPPSDAWLKETIARLS